MARITIPRLDGATERWLRRRAARHGTSIGQEILDILAVAQADELAARLDHPAARSLRLARALGVQTPRSGTILRADRDARGG